MTETATVFLVDRDPAARDDRQGGLLRAAGFEVEEFATAADFLEGGNAARPGCLVIDIEIAGPTGVELLQMLADRHSALPVVFLCGRGHLGNLAQAMRAGAFDFLARPARSDDLVPVVRLALEQNRASRASRKAMDAVQHLLATLTPREREVLPLVVAGNMNKQIAARLGTAERTVKLHRSHVMTKLRVRTLPDLVRLADRAGVSFPVLYPGEYSALQAPRELAS